MDTGTFLWTAIDAPELSVRARHELIAVDGPLFLSSVSSWEIALKYSLGKLTLPEHPETLLPRIRENDEIESLPLDEESTV